MVMELCMKNINWILFYYIYILQVYIISRFHDSGSRILWKRQQQRQQQQRQQQQRQQQQYQYKYQPNPNPNPQLLQTGLVDKAP